MLFCFGSLVALLSLFYTVFASVCSFNYTKGTKFTAMSDKYPGHECEYILHAPSESNIVLNFTDIFGFKSEQNSSVTNQGKARESNRAARPALANATAASTTTTTTAGSCLPQVQISKLVSGSETTVLQTFCRGRGTFNTPQVFRTNFSVIRVLYKWLPGSDSGFTLDFSFHQKKNICKLSCDGQGCPKGAPLICKDGVAGCQDGSDKANCNTTVSPPGAAAPTTDYIPIIVIIVPVVFILGTCVVSYYRVALRVWRDHHSRGAQGMEQHRQLHPQPTAPSSGSNRQSTTVYVPGSTQDRLQRQFAAVREKHHLPSSQRREPSVDLPPHISISEDGEEGFAHYQRLLQRPLNPRDVESVRPPPNRTVYDGESPPSYHSNSAITLDQETSVSTHLSSSDCNGWSALLPCRRSAPANSSSVSNLVNSGCGHSISGHTRCSRHPSGGSSSGSVSNSLDRPPPEYSVVMASEEMAPHSVDLQSAHRRTDGHL
ncbi:uncharacterized protein LOC135466067 isoform X2 [Liolophura sinensis]|uniref:uncharacterized protein LOC135466067 isoform X2 n=1 Tax=Liolophura sinensis TaxID=3198878 RepID=UPI00315856C0